MGKLLRCLLIIILFVSCTAEKTNLTAPGVMTANGMPHIESWDSRRNTIVYSAEITNLIASFPRFRNTAVNDEVSNLKYHLKDYIGAMEAYNMNGLERAHRNFEKSYKKLQKLRKYMRPDEDQILNRYLVRIKTNMAFLESTVKKDSANSR